MRFVFYFLIISQFVNFLGVFAEKVKEYSSKFNPIKWEKVRENEEKPLKKIIWKSYEDDKNYFEKTNIKNKLKKNFNEAQKESSTWRFRPAHQWYFDVQRKGGSLRDMQLLGGKIDLMLGDWWYITGQGLSTYGGGGGGYSEGHGGVGILGPRWKNLRFYGEMLIGAGGGGGVDSGSGLMFKPSIGLEYNFNKDLSLQTGVGKVISKEGNLDANTFDVGLVWRFGTPK